MSVQDRVSEEPTPWAVICAVHGQVYLTEDEYVKQLERPNSYWRCPRCNMTATWDDANYERRVFGDDPDEESDDA